jgi:hypothetical protein
LLHFTLVQPGRGHPRTAFRELLQKIHAHLTGLSRQALGIPHDLAGNELIAPPARKLVFKRLK